MAERHFSIVVKDEASRATARGVLDRLAVDEKKKWRVTVERVKNVRSLSQNALMWMWINRVGELVSEHTGMDNDEIHEFFKSKFLPGKVLRLGGEIAVYRTTTTLSKAEMHDYMERIYAFASTELGLNLPLPEEMHLHE